MSNAATVLRYYSKRDLEKASQQGLKLSSSFNEWREFIAKKSELRPLLECLPVVSLLHSHLEALVDRRWVIKYLIESENAWIRVLPSVEFLFSREKPEGDWQPIKKVREAYPGGDVAFDDWVYGILTVASDEYDHLDTETKMWQHFQNCFISFRGVWHFFPFFSVYFEHFLRRYKDLGIFHVECRAPPFEAYDLDGRSYSFRDILNEMRRILALVNASIPADEPRLTFKFIYSVLRFVDAEVVASELEACKKLMNEFSDLIVGFDLVGHETLGHSLDFYSKPLTDFMGELDYFFHAGETHIPSDNIYNALLLGTRRIGHGYALTKEMHSLVKEKDVCIEACPISNRALLLCHDLSKHPVIEFIKHGVPVSINSDDPALFGYEGLVHDFFMLFMMQPDLSLDMLKELLDNSVQYSALDNDEKIVLQEVLDGRWTKFLENLEGHVLN